MRFSRCAPFVFLVVLLSQLVVAQQSSLSLNSPSPAPVTGVTANVVGNTGNASYTYFVVAAYPIGNAAPSSGAFVGQAPGTLSSTNSVRVSWQAVTGATSYTLLRTTTPNLPATCAACKLVTMAGTTYNDIGSSLTSYTLTTAPGASSQITLNNQSGIAPYLDYVLSNPTPVTGVNKIPVLNGVVTVGDCVKIGTLPGQIVDAGAACGSGGGGSPGGTTGQTQYNNAGAFGGYTPSGDATVNVGTGVVTVSGLNGTSLASLATGFLFNTAGTITSIASSGSGNVALVNSPTFITPALGTPSALVLTNATGLLASGVVNAQGTGAKFQFSTGTATSGHCVQFDATGNTIDAGAACGTSSGGITALTGDGTAMGPGSAALTVTRLNGTSLAGLASGLLFNTTGTGIPSIATGSQILTAIGNIPVTSLNSGTGASSTTFWRGDGTWATPINSGGTVTSVGFTGGLISVSTPTTTPAFTVAGTSGGMPYFNSASTWATTAALTANALIKGGGPGVAPSPSTVIDNGTTVSTTEPFAAPSVSLGSAPPASSVCTSTSSFLCMGEGVAPTGTLTGVDVLYPDSTAHRFKMNNNNGGAVQVVASGVDINTSDQVVSTHLTAPLPINQGGTGTAGTLTGLVRGSGSAFTASEISGDGTTSGSNVLTVQRLNGAVVPTSAAVLSSNASNQLVASAVQGNGLKAQLSTGSTTTNDCVKFDANGNTVDAGAACGSGGGGGGGGTSGWSGITLSLLANATQFTPPVGGALTSTTETVVSLPANAAATLSHLSVTLSASLGTGTTLTVTLEDGTATPSTLTCTTASAGTTCVDNTDSVNVTLGDLLSFKIVATGTVTGATPQLVIGYAIGTSGVGTTSFSSGNLSPLFTTSVATSTTTPSQTFTASTFAANKWYGNNTGSTATPGVNSIGTNDVTPNLYAAGGGTAQAQTVTLTPAATALTTGLIVHWKPTAANTAAAPTLAVNGLTATAVTKCGTAALVANDLTTTAIAEVFYDGTQFQLLNPQAVGCGSSSSSLAVVQLAQVTTSGSQATVSFTIPSGYSAFTIEGTGQNSASSNVIGAQFNGDATTAHYTSQYLNQVPGGGSNPTGTTNIVAATTGATSIFTLNCIAYVISNTTHSCNAFDTSSGLITFASGVWTPSGATAITSVVLSGFTSGGVVNGTWTNGQVITLYGKP